jgi:Xaa-Pro aminopeptidase
MAVNSVISVDNFIRNIIHYKEKWNTYFNKICEVVGAAAKEEVQEKGELCIELENIEKLNIDKFQQWKEKFGVEKITDLLPFQDVGVMLEISKDIKNMPEVKSGKEIERVYESMKIIERNFAKAESSYELSRLKKDNLNYSERIHEILEIVDICSVSEELKNDLKVQYQTDDTVIA